MIFKKKKETDVYKSVNLSLASKIPFFPKEHPIFNFNISETGKICKGASSIFEKKLYVLKENEEKPTVYELSDVEKIYVREYYGSTAVEATINGKEKELFRAGLSLIEDLKRMTDVFSDEGISVEGLFNKNAGNKKDASKGRGGPPPFGAGGPPLSVSKSGKPPKAIGGKCPKCGRRIPPREGICPHCAEKKPLLKWLWTFVYPHKFKLICAVLLFFIASLLNLVAPNINRIVIDDYLKGNNENTNKYLLWIALMAITAFSVIIVQIIRSVLMTKIGMKISVSLKNEMFKKIQTLSMSNINNRMAGEYISRLSNDTNVVKQCILDIVPQIIQQGLMFLTIIPVLFVINPLMAFLILLPVPLLIAGFYFIRSYIRRIYHRQWQAGTESSNVLHDIFQGIRIVKAFGMEKAEEKRYLEASAKQAKIEEQNEKMWNMLFPVINFFMSSGEYVVLIFVGYKVLSGDMTIGQISQLSSYVALVYGPLRWMAMVPRQLSRAITSAFKLFEVIEEEPDVMDTGLDVKSEIKGDIHFDNVSFGYDEYKPVLKGADFKIKSGEMVGLVGRSGVGKSTAINLIMRLYDVTGGNIYIDGVNIKDYSQSYLRSRIGVVLQETYLFKGTIEANIKYAKPEATAEEIIAAAKMAHAHEFIMRLPDGYNTYISEKGMSLSGGERQRIAIARAVLRDPDILILDEATAALDIETEKLIQEALARITKGKTTVAIAHRLSTLKNANKIVVFDEGKVEEEGTHKELLKRKGRYYKLVSAQRKMAE